MKQKAAILLCTAMILSLTACSGSGEGRKQESGEVSVEGTGAVTEASGEELFPASYTGGTELVKFDCDLEIPEEFDPQNFYIPRISGLQYINRETAYDTYVEGKEIEEEYHDPQDDKNAPSDDYYILQDGTNVSINQGINYSRPESSIYAYVMRDNEAGASQNDFSFGTGENSVSQVKEALAKLDFPVDEYQFSWFSLSGQEHIELEQEKLANGIIGTENMRTDWTQIEGEYEIYAWQIYGGLQVFPPIMSMGHNLAFENYQMAPVNSVFSDQGMLSLRAEAPYDFEKTDEAASFLPFSELVSAVEEKYDQLLIEDGIAYTVERAKLAVRVYMDETQSEAAEPVWYFEVSDSNGASDVLLFNALTGKEIFLA